MKIDVDFGFEVKGFDGMKIEIVESPKSVRIKTLGQNQFEVNETFCVKFKKDGGKIIVFSVFDGFNTDLGSVPRIFRPLLSVASAPAAFIVHDFLYSRSSWMPRKDADALMLALMDYYETPKWRWKRRLAWLGVRAGGWAAYKGGSRNAAG